MSKPRKYQKPVSQDLNAISFANGSCMSGIGVPNQCVANGFNNGTSCVGEGIGVGSPFPSCNPSGFLAVACATGTGAQ
jgi:hypothetical protein